MNSALEDLATHQAAYRFLDTEIVLRSDRGETVARFDAIYGRFGVSSPAPHALIGYVLAGDRPCGGPALILDDKTYLSVKW